MKLYHKRNLLCLSRISLLLLIMLPLLTDFAWAKNVITKISFDLVQHDLDVLEEPPGDLVLAFKHSNDGDVRALFTDVIQVEIYKYLKDQRQRVHNLMDVAVKKVKEAKEDNDQKAYQAAVKRLNAQYKEIVEKIDEEARKIAEKEFADLKRRKKALRSEKFAFAKKIGNGIFSVLASIGGVIASGGTSIPTYISGINSTVKVIKDIAEGLGTMAEATDTLHMEMAALNQAKLRKNIESRLKICKKAHRKYLAQLRKIEKKLPKPRTELEKILDGVEQARKDYKGNKKALDNIDESEDKVMELIKTVQDIYGELQAGIAQEKDVNNILDDVESSLKNKKDQNISVAKKAGGIASKLNDWSETVANLGARSGAILNGVAKWVEPLKKATAWM